MRNDKQYKSRAVKLYGADQCVVTVGCNEYVKKYKKLMQEKGSD